MTLLKYILSLIFIAGTCEWSNYPQHDPTVCDSVNVVDSITYDTIPVPVPFPVPVDSVVYDTIPVHIPVYDTNYINLDTCQCEPTDIPLDGATATTIWNNNDWQFLCNQTGANILVKPPAYIEPGSIDQLRSKGTNSCHFFFPASMTDFDRAEIHSDYPIMGNVIEGSVMYLGWSDYYVHVSTDAGMTILQLRTADRNVIAGCPDISLTIGSVSEGITNLGIVNGIIVNMLDGKQENGAVIRNLRKHIWYDFVIGVKFSKENDGYFTIWAGEEGTLNYENPTYSYSGNTMFNLEQIEDGWNCGMTEDQCHTPQLRWGIYQFRTPRTLFESYKGPVRINLNEEGKTAFLKVIPR